MKTLIFLFGSLLFCVSAQARQSDETQMRSIINSQNKDTITIAVLVYADMTLQDFAGPVEVFSKAQRLTQGKYQVFTVGLTKEKISSENGIVEILPDYSIENLPDADYLVLPGAPMPIINKMMKNETLKEFISHWNSKKDKTIVSVCSSAYLLANTGLLNHKKATTHYLVADDFSKLFPSVHVIKNVRFVDAGSFISSSGITSGIDAALYIVGQNTGEKTRLLIAQILQYDYHEQKTWPSLNGIEYNRKKTSKRNIF